MTVPSEVVVFGAGGHAKVVADVLRSAGVVVRAFLAASANESIGGVPVLDESTAVEEMAVVGELPGAFVAIGDNSVRTRVAARVRERGFSLVNAISPTAYLAHDVVLGTGILIAPQAAINAASVIGDDVIINTGATVDHDNTISTGAHIAPGSHLAGNVSVGERSFLGVGTAVIPGITIGADAVVGAGSVVIRDIPSHARAWGNPAREKGSQP